MPQQHHNVYYHSRDMSTTIYMTDRRRVRLFAEVHPAKHEDAKFQGPYEVPNVIVAKTSLKLCRKFHGGACPFRSASPRTLKLRELKEGQGGNVRLQSPNLSQLTAMRNLILLSQTLRFRFESLSESDASGSRAVPYGGGRREI
jgi:hypothetical protein